MFPDEHLLGIRRPPRLVRNSSYRDARTAERATAVEIQSGRDRYQRKFIACAIAYLQIVRVIGVGRLRKIDRENQFAWPQIRIYVGRVSGQPMEIGKGNGTLAARTLYANAGVERCQRYAHIGRV